MRLRTTVALLVGLALAFSVAILAAYAQPLAAGCARFGFGYNEFPGDDPRVHQFGDAEGKGVPLRKVSYDFRATNNDTGWSKRYRGTDPAVDGEWHRAVAPKVGFGFLTFTYNATAYREDGGFCSANKHTLTDIR